MEVLREENDTEQDKPAFQEIEKHERFTFNFDKRGDEEYHQQQVSYQVAVFEQSSGRTLGINPNPLSILGNGRNPVAEGIIFIKFSHVGEVLK